MQDLYMYQATADSMKKVMNNQEAQDSAALVEKSAIQLTAQEPLDQNTMDSSEEPNELINCFSSSTSTSQKTKRDEDDAEGPCLVEFFCMRYRNFRIKVFKQRSEMSSTVKYFYNPILLLDPHQIQTQVNKATGQAYVRFTVKMWDEDVEDQVVKWLKRLPGSRDVEDYCVQTMPFEEIRLIAKKGVVPSNVYRLSEHWKAYDHLPQTFQFQLHCESKEAVENLAESFRADPVYLMQDLALECATNRFAVAVNGPRRKRPRLEDESSSGIASNLVQFSTVLNFNISSDEHPARGNGGKYI